MYCYRHPKAETALSCGKCERPICTKCMVSGPAGIRCPDCASLRTSHLYKVNVLHVVIQSVIGLAAGAIGAAIVGEIDFFFFFVFFLASAYGGLVAELMLKAIGRKHGKIVELVGAMSFVAGGLAPVMVSAVELHAVASKISAVDPFGFLWLVLISQWRALLSVIIAAVSCYGRLKYF